MRKNICVDMDGVLSNFEKFFCQQFGYDRRDVVKLELRYPDMASGISIFTNSVQTYRNLEVIPLGLEIIKYIDSLDEYDICIVSSRPEYCLNETHAWLKKNQIPYMTLSCGPDKIKRIMKLDPLFAVDDLGEVGQELRRIGVPTILVSSPWNKKFEADFPRISEFPMFLWQFERICDGSKITINDLR